MDLVKNFYSLNSFITIEFYDKLFQTSFTNLGGINPHWNHKIIIKDVKDLD